MGRINAMHRNRRIEAQTRGGIGFWFFVLAMMALSPVSAEAQDQAGASLPSLLIPLEPPESAPATGTAGGTLFNARPLGADFGRSLANLGVYLVARDIADEIETRDGAKQGGSLQGFSSLGFDLDMNRIAGVSGGAVHFLLSDLRGQPFSAYSGSAYLNNRIFAGNGPALRLNEFSYEQRLFDNQVDLRVGRISPYTQFDGSELYCTFITSICRTPAAYTFDRGYSPYLSSSWAGVAQIRISGPFYTNIGVFENEPILADTNHGGFPGPDWGLRYADGVTIPVQFGYRTTVADDQYPRAFSVGGFYNTESYADPLLNVAGANRILFGGAAKTDYDLSQVYVQAQQMVYRPDTSDRGLTLFTGATWATSGEPAVERMMFGGAYYRGPFAQRPNDSFGVAVTVLYDNPRITERVDTLLSRDGGGHVSRAEMSYETYYGFHLAPGLSVKPFFGFISHPDQASVAKPNANDTYAIYFGTLLEVNLPGMFGLPVLSQ